LRLLLDSWRRPGQPRKADTRGIVPTIAAGAEPDVSALWPGRKDGARTPGVVGKGRKEGIVSRTTRWAASLAAVVAVALSLGAVSATTAASTTHRFVPVDVSFSDAGLCGFQLDFRIEGTLQVTDFFDASGTLYKQISTGASLFTITNPANGKTARTTQSFNQTITFTPEGFIDTVTESGLVFNFVLPGVGTVFMDVGTLRIDSGGNILFVHGPHQGLAGDIAGFCNALADP
jgi:hypothetical protein